MRVVFCGSGTLAVPCLRAVLDSAHEVVLTVTQPARPAGRGGKLRPTPVAEFARSVGLDPWECGNINTPQSVARLGAAGADVMCVVDFGQMIRQAARDQVSVDTFNVHASLLPELRGAAPANWALIRGHTETGVTTFSLVDKMDAGDIYLQTPTDIVPAETAEELKDRLAKLGAAACRRTLDLLAAGKAAARSQDESRATLAPKLAKADGLIDWSQPAGAVCGLVCGTWPWPGGQTVLRRGTGQDIRVILARAVVAEGAAAGEPGTLDEELCVAAGAGRVRILEIKPAGKRRMSWSDFANGYRPKPGEILLRPDR